MRVLRVVMVGFSQAGRQDIVGIARIFFVEFKPTSPRPGSISQSSEIRCSFAASLSWLRAAKPRPRARCEMAPVAG